jgi:hypothetical protein
VSRLAWLACALLPLAAAAKEKNPLGGALTPARLAAPPGKVVSLSLRLETAEAFPAVRVALEAPTGTVLLAGAPSAELRGLAPDHPRTLRWRLKVVAPGEQKIWVEATVLGLGEAVLRRQFLTIVNPAPPWPGHEPTFRVNEKGERLRVQDVGN